MNKRLGTEWLAAAIIATCACAGGVWAADVTWDGNGDANNGGNWSTAANWDTDAVPTTADRAILPSVVSGHRTVTQDIAAGTTANAIRFVQDNPDGISKLDLAGNLTLSKGSRNATMMNDTASAFQVSLSNGATQDQIIVNLNGKQIYFATSSGSSNTGGNLAGIINFNSNNSTIYAAAGHSYFNIFGTLNVTANGNIGRAASSQGNAALNFLSGSALNVTGNSTFISTATGSIQSSRTFQLTNLGNINIETGSTLAHRMTNDSNGQLYVRNNDGGQIALAGTLEVRGGNSTTSAIGITNSGNWIISGNSARILRYGQGTNSQMPSFTNNSTGTLRGAGGEDIAEYDRAGTVSEDPRMTITNAGMIQPGAGSRGAGTTSVGTLALRDIDVTDNAGKIELDLGGTAAGQYDRLRLLTGDTDPAGAGTLNLSAGTGTLQLWTVNGFAPTSQFTITLIEAGSVSGTFGTVKLDDATFTDNELDAGAGWKYQLGYAADSVTLAYIPEPATMGLFLGAAALLALRRRIARD